MSAKRRGLGLAGAMVMGVLAALVACGGSEDKSKIPNPGRPSCSADSDCVLTTSSGCCSSCAETPHAIPTLTFEQQKNRCAAVECAPRSDRIECPKVDPPAGYQAKCNAGTCAAVKPK